jgi:hypothetical protein
MLGLQLVVAVGAAVLLEASSPASSRKLPNPPASCRCCPPTTGARPAGEIGEGVRGTQPLVHLPRSLGAYRRSGLRVGSTPALLRKWQHRGLERPPARGSGVTYLLRPYPDALVCNRDCDIPAASQSSRAYRSTPRSSFWGRLVLRLRRCCRERCAVSVDGPRLAHAPRRPTEAGHRPS